MKKGIRLIHFEFERLSKFLYALIGILITSQALGRKEFRYDPLH